MRVFAFCIIFIWLNPIFSQNVAEEIYDTAKRIDPLSMPQDALLRGGKFDSKTDSSMLFFQQYDKTKKDNIGIQNLGDVNTPYINLQFKPIEKTGLMLGFTPFQNLYLSSENARFYNAVLPYTEFQYAQGKGGRRGMIDFDAMHTQNFGKKFNLTAIYHSTSNDGFYSRQSLSCKNLLLSSYYKSNSERYNSSLIFAWNKLNFQESAGIVQTESNEALFKRLPSNARIVPVSLNNAKNINRYSELKFSQVYWLLMQSVGESKKLKGRLGLSHQFTWIKSSNYYTDKGSDFNFYGQQYYFNQAYSADSFSCRQASNKLEIFTPINQGFAFKAGLRYDHYSVYQMANLNNHQLTIIHNNSVDAQFNFNFRKRWRSEAKGYYFYEGYNQGDYLLKWENSSVWGKEKQWQIKANLLANARKAQYRESHLMTNHYRWDQSLQKTNQKSISVQVSKDMRRPKAYDAFNYTLAPKAIEFAVNYTLLDGFIFYNYNNTVQQGGNGQSCLQAVGKLHGNFKKLQVHEELVYQVFSKELQSQILLPQVISKTSLYYQTYAFKKASFIQIGIDAQISSSYQANLYNPGLANFRQSTRSVGGYPFLDFFINAEVKTARIFFKIEHINQNWQDVNTYSNYMFTSPYQASAPMRLRLGFAWKFYYWYQFYHAFKYFNIWIWPSSSISKK